MPVRDERNVYQSKDVKKWVDSKDMLGGKVLSFGYRLNIKTVKTK